MYPSPVCHVCVSYSLLSQKWIHTVFPGEMIQSLAWRAARMDAHLPGTILRSMF
jgi:hypothetical protein